LLQYYVYKSNYYTPVSDVTPTMHEYLPKKNSVNTALFFSIFSSNFFRDRLESLTNKKTAWALCA